MNRYVPLTGIDLFPASLLIDIQAPLDVLHAMADYRIRTVTQVLENIAFRAEIGCDTVVNESRHQQHSYKHKSFRQ
ncbi:hypothetical protein ACVK1X_006299 [Pseudomonas sp. PvR086]|jgi:hypothetical protein|uniref:hypothetical protein n=1 Tax=Pseudomonas TaxID=286 RepID=UPI000B357DB3|nr:MULTISPECIES: hypothetical protein [Pseudomonas]MBD9609663.1 hypothetical protein [Pseudomonas sp. PDM08]MDR7109895.1 hypothetical protein [Pseudomonas frederiksbergensis]PMY45332.1 hypothetical protein C1X70_29465 [Pseudomonas sp. FW305-53]PMY83464.1 hypothetical protein C1X68_29585 [Pseudomonas sp. FW303-C2]PMY89357.1 hypothetical protein C1X67_29480 [Pseudomonas sp. FW305-62]